MNRTIKSTISQRKDLLDKNRNQYLILELDNGESIFVFSGKVNEEKWGWLEEGKEINFTVEEGRNGANLLVDYVIEV
jgi:cold shock CspA family protein